MTYSLDLINSCINYYKSNTLSTRAVAKIFSVSKSVLCNWLKELPIVYNNNKHITSNITSKMLLFLKNSLNHNPYQTQSNMMHKINNKFNINISSFTIKTMLKIIGYSKKKVSRKLYNKNLKEHICKHKKFKKEIKTININDIVCIDETGVTRNTYNDKGYCHTSKRLKYYVDISKLPRNRNIIVAINKDKVIHYKVLINKSVNKIYFIEFITELVKNIKHKYILLDNIAFHHSKEVIKIIEDSDNKILFTPPYSPEYNPIEEVFSSFKSYLKNKISVINGFVKLDYYIDTFLRTANDFNCYYQRSFR